MSCFECPSCKLCRILCIRYMLVAEKASVRHGTIMCKNVNQCYPSFNVRGLSAVFFQHSNYSSYDFAFLQRNASPQNYLLRVNYERDFVNSIRLRHLRFEIKCAIIIIVQLFAHLKMFDIFFRVRYFSTLRSFSCRFLPVYD